MNVVISIIGIIVVGSWIYVWRTLKTGGGNVKSRRIPSQQELVEFGIGLKNLERLKAGEFQYKKSSSKKL